jgi:prepilin-type N-terminal cleavage/methylation domain-containing protein
MSHRERSRGFSLIEILLVLAIIGILSGIAIPSFMGQRRRARVIGDAISNTKVMQMMLESRKADNGLYGTAGTYTWTNGVASGAAATLLPSFSPSGNSQMNYTLTIAAGGLTYTISAFDPKLSLTNEVYQTDQAGTQLKRAY